MSAHQDIIAQEDLYHRLSAQQAPTGETSEGNHFLVAFYAHWMPLTRLKARLPASSVVVVP
jgi:dolichyl-phosphate-mannose--protein O-mannosyl transferase